MTDAAVTEYMKIRRYVVNQIYKAHGKSVQIPTILELAKQFRVSHATVSKAMKELTNEGLIIGKRGIGSFTNPRLSVPQGTRKLPVIGILMGDGMGVHFDKYLAPILAQMLQQLVCLPATVHLLTLGSLDPDIIYREIVNEQLDGLLWESPPEKAVGVAQRLQKEGMPLVILERDVEGIPSAMFDFEAWGEECGRQLLKEGRKHIVLLPDTSPWDRSFNGIRRVYREAGISLNENLFLKDRFTCLDELRKVIAYGVPVDAVCNTLFAENEVNDVLLEMDTSLTERCCLVQSSLAQPPHPGFHQIIYELPFETLIGEGVRLMKSALNKSSSSVECRRIRLPMILKQDK